MKKGVTKAQLESLVTRIADVLESDNSIIEGLCSDGRKLVQELAELTDKDFSNDFEVMLENKWIIFKSDMTHDQVYDEEFKVTVECDGKVVETYTTCAEDVRE